MDAWHTWTRNRPDNGAARDGQRISRREQKWASSSGMASRLWEEERLNSWGGHTHVAAERDRRGRIGPGAGFLDAINEALGLGIPEERLPEISKSVNTNWRYMLVGRAKLDKEDGPNQYFGLMAALGEEEPE